MDPAIADPGSDVPLEPTDDVRDPAGRLEHSPGDHGSRVPGWNVHGLRQLPVNVCAPGGETTRF